MRVEASNAESAATPAGARARSSRPVFRLVQTLLACAATALLSVAGYRALLPGIGRWAAERGHDALRSDISLLSGLARVPGRLLRSVEIPRIIIDVKFADMQKLTKKRNEAMSRGVLFKDEDDYVPAAVRHDGRSTKVELRLKGDWTDHLEGDKWSFRIHVKGDDQILGLRRFSIQNPKTRGYQGEALFFETLRHEGIIAPRYFFAGVTLNGKDVGLMAVEEHYSKELLESNGRREGVILRFDETLLWQSIAAYDGWRGAFDDYRNASIDAFGSRKIDESETLSRQRAAAAGLLRGFVEGTLTPAQVFDAERMGRFLAVAELWGSWHSRKWNNQRFYFNPLTAVLEPAPFDADLQERSKPEALNMVDEPLVASELGDPVVFAAYVRALRSLAREVVQGDLVMKLQSAEKPLLETLRKEFFLLEPFPWPQLAQRATLILAQSDDEMRPGSAPLRKYPAIVKAALVPEGSVSVLEIASAVPDAVEVESIRWIPEGGGPSAVFQTLPPVALPLQLPQAPPHTVARPIRIRCVPPGGPARFSVQVAARIRGHERVYQVRALPSSAALAGPVVPTATIESLATQYPFLEVDREKKAIRVRAGTWAVPGWLAVPSGFTLEAGGGTTLRFEEDGGLVSRGALRFEGTEAAPVVLDGRMLGTSAGTWQGLVVLGAADRSRWSYVTVRNTRGVSRPGWELTGGVTFHESDVAFDHCRFEGSRGEDAVNVVRSRYEAAHLAITRSFSDGLDADFSEGTLSDPLFEEIGTSGSGDAIDLGGSTATIKGGVFRGVADKAVSVGERSALKASGIVVENVSIGVASKDSSRAEIADSSISGARTAALMAYVKKPEFSGAALEARGVSFPGTAVRARCQKGSTLTIDGAAVEAEDLDVKRLYGKL